MENKKQILDELSGHLAAACDCLSFLRDKAVSDPEAISPKLKVWATKNHSKLFELLNEVDENKKQ